VTDDNSEVDESFIYWAESLSSDRPVCTTSHPTLHHLGEVVPGHLHVVLRRNRLSIADPDALVGPMWPQHGSFRFEVPVTFLIEPLLVN